MIKVFVKGKAKDFRGAIADYTKAIEIRPNYINAYFDRGLAKLNLGQKDSGCLDLSKAGELGHEEAYNLIKDFCK
ncbi:tetratricopeptide repeat protein [Saprospiraceae bacterium]|nr:tetratricopeptide repeat protein [Saprospiraceae bacterium]